MKNDEGAAKQLGQSPQDQANSMQEMYAAQKPPPPLQPNNEKLDIENLDELAVQVQAQIITPAQFIAQIQQLIDEARLQSFKAGYERGRFDKEMDDKYPDPSRNTNGKG